MLQADPGSARLHEAAAAIDLLLGKIDAAVAHLEASLRIRPDSAEAHYNLATALIRQGRPAEAETHLRLAIQIQPGHVGAHVNLGAVLRAQNRRDEAIAHLTQALQIDPRNAAAHANLGGALQTNPDLLEPLTDLAWILATARDGSLRAPDEAVRLAERATALTGRGSIRALDALGAAHAAAGNFEQAQKAVQAAIDLAGAGKPVDETVRLLRGHLDLYRQGKALIEP
jgi:tetratricopeptide (TPR) repeat protein